MSGSKTRKAEKSTRSSSSSKQSSRKAKPVKNEEDEHELSIDEIEDDDIEVQTKPKRHEKTERIERSEQVQDDDVNEDQDHNEGHAPFDDTLPIKEHETLSILYFLSRRGKETNNPVLRSGALSLMRQLRSGKPFYRHRTGGSKSRYPQQQFYHSGGSKTRYDDRAFNPRQEQQNVGYVGYERNHQGRQQMEQFGSHPQSSGQPLYGNRNWSSSRN
jgi:hypothetical protein